MSDEVSLYEILGHWTSRLSRNLDLCETGCGQRRSRGRMMCDEHCKEHLAAMEDHRIRYTPDPLMKGYADPHQWWLDGKREQYFKEHRSLWMAWI